MYEVSSKSPVSKMRDDFIGLKKHEHPGFVNKNRMSGTCFHMMPRAEENLLFFFEIPLRYAENIGSQRI